MKPLFNIKICTSKVWKTDELDHEIKAFVFS